MVLNDVEAGDLACIRIGGPLLFGRLWERLGLGAVVNDLLDGRGFEFALERAVFVSVLHRLFVSGSDRSCEKWMVMSCTTRPTARPSEKQAAKRSTSPIARSAAPSSKAPASEVITPPPKSATTARPSRRANCIAGFPAGARLTGHVSSRAILTLFSSWVMSFLSS